MHQIYPLQTEFQDQPFVWLLRKRRKQNNPKTKSQINSIKCIYAKDFPFPIWVGGPKMEDPSISQNNNIVNSKIQNFFIFPTFFSDPKQKYRSPDPQFQG